MKWNLAPLCIYMGRTVKNYMVVTVFSLLFLYVFLYICIYICIIPLQFKRLTLLFFLKASFSSEPMPKITCSNTIWTLKQRLILSAEKLMHQCIYETLHTQKKTKKKCVEKFAVAAVTESHLKCANLKRNNNILTLKWAKRVFTYLCHWKSKIVGKITD